MSWADFVDFSKYFALKMYPLIVVHVKWNPTYNEHFLDKYVGSCSCCFVWCGKCLCPFGIRRPIQSCLDIPLTLRKWTGRVDWLYNPKLILPSYPLRLTIWRFAWGTNITSPIEHHVSPPIEHLVSPVSPSSSRSGSTSSQFPMNNLVQLQNWTTDKQTNSHSTTQNRWT